MFIIVLFYVDVFVCACNNHIHVCVCAVITVWVERQETEIAFYVLDSNSTR